MVLVAGSTGATSIHASTTGATFIEAPVLLTMCYQHQCNARNTLLEVQFTVIAAHGAVI